MFTEAYAQRDPLVQYKNKASELFRGLIEDMRTGVVTKMYTYRPRNLSSVQSEVSRIAADQPGDEITTPQPEKAGVAIQSGSEETKTKATKSTRGKRKRRRRRR